MEEKREGEPKLLSLVKNAYLKGKARVTATRHGNPGRGLKVLAVVGTHGKTTTARYLHELLQEAGRKSALLAAEEEPGTSAARVQEFLQQAKKDGSDYAIVTLNSDLLQQYSLASTPVELAVVTAICDTPNEPADTQLHALRQFLAKEPKYIVFNRDDNRSQELRLDDAAAQKITYGEHEEAEARIVEPAYYRKGSEFKLVIDHQTELNLATFLIGKANVQNLAAAVTSLYVMGEPISAVDEGAARLEKVQGNYEYLDVSAPYDMVLDWAPDETALQAVVLAAKQVAKRRLLVVAQSEGNSDNALVAVAKQSARLVVVGSNDRTYGRATIDTTDTADAGVQRALRSARQGDTVLLAGPMFARHQDDATYAAMTTNSMQD